MNKEISEGLPESRIYFLYDPRDGSQAPPRYVGKTSKTVRRRLTQHIGAARKGDTTYRSHWIRSLLAQECKPEIVCLEDDIPENLVNDREKYWIAVFRSLGAPLTNLTDGGDGTPGRKMTEHERQRVIAMQVERWSNPKSRAILVKSIRDSDRWTQQTRLQQSDQMNKLWSDVDFRRRAREGMRRSWSDPQHRSLMIELAEARWKNPEFKASWWDAYLAAKESQRAGLRRAWTDLSYRATKSAQASIQMSKHWEDPKNRAAMSGKQKRVWSDPAYRERRKGISQAQGLKMSEVWKDPVFRENQSKKQSTAARKRMSDPVEKEKQQRRMAKARESWVNLPPCQHCGRQIPSPAALANHVRKCGGDGKCRICRSAPRLDNRTLCNECFKKSDRDRRQKRKN